jgi:spore coat polysaccharide biosynthesis predicted glycosyltransferase SpsG
MDKPSIHFRTRGGPNYGWGNVHRLADFADRCRKRGHDTIRFFAEGPDSVVKYLIERGFETIALAEDISLEEESSILESYPNSAVLICEMLDCTPAVQLILRSNSRKLVIFDDLLDHQYNADLIVCAQALPAYGNIDISDPGARFLTGYEYFMYSSAFSNNMAHSRCHADAISSILIAFGGGSYEIAYIKAARAIAEMSTELEATFVLGFAADKMLKGKIANILPKAKILGGVNNMAELLSDACLAILSAGYLKLEAAITGTPAVLVATQWHQIPLAQEFVKRTNAPYVGYMGFTTIASIIEAVASLSEADERRKLSAATSKIVDVNGFDRVYDAIFGETT